MDDFRVLQSSNFVKREEARKIDFSEVLRSYMTRNYETNYRLAKDIGVSQTTVANWLAGKTTPSIHYFGKLVSHYGDEFCSEAKQYLA